MSERFGSLQEDSDLKGGYRHAESLSSEPTQPESRALSRACQMWDQQGGTAAQHHRHGYHLGMWCVSHWTPTVTLHNTLKNAIYRHIKTLNGSESWYIVQLNHLSQAPFKISIGQYTISNKISKTASGLLSFFVSSSMFVCNFRSFMILMQSAKEKSVLSFSNSPRPQSAMKVVES